MRAPPFFAWLLLAAMLVPVAGASGQEPVDLGADPEWKFRVMPLIWFTQVRGEVTAKGVPASADINFSDILENLDMGFLGAADVRRGDLAFHFFGMYTDIGQEIRWSKGPFGGRVDVSLETAILDGVLGYRLFSSPADGIDLLDRVDLELIAGARHTYLRLELDPSTLSTIDGSKSWTDPVIGTRVGFGSPSGLSLGLRGDVGGFGVGSDRTWRLTATLGYPLSDLIALSAGYHVISYDYDDGDGSDRFEFNARFGGPFLGAVFSF